MFECKTGELGTGFMGQAPSCWRLGVDPLPGEPGASGSTAPVTNEAEGPGISACLVSSLQNRHHFTSLKCPP